jgi:NTP pyrophosphatase (non-canonical NTP hydrolase)
MNMDKQTIINRVNVAHGNAVDKGWWQEERSLGELVALIHSEASEALEDFRNGHEPTDVWYEKKDASTGQIKTMALQPFDDWKPCGIPSELADIVIRVYDLVGKLKMKERFSELLNERFKTDISSSMRSHVPFGDNVGWLHVSISGILLNEVEQATAKVVYDTYKLAEYNGIDLDYAIAEKMVYNATRPHRHGGKKL